MDIGVLLPTGKAQWGADGHPRELVAFAVRAEQLGFSSLFVNDSLISARIEALTMLAALAPVTERVTLGTGALLPFPRRRPADLARRRDPGRACPHRTALRRLAALPARPRRLRIRSAGRTENGGPGRTLPRRHHARAVRVRT